LAWSVTSANRNDITQLIPLVDAIPAVRGPRGGRPRKRPERVLADRGYDHDKYRRLLRARGIAHSFARRQTEHGTGLGSQRYVVERRSATCTQNAACSSAPTARSAPTKPFSASPPACSATADSATHLVRTS
jgi:transposase